MSKYKNTRSKTKYQKPSSDRNKPELIVIVKTFTEICKPMNTSMGKGSYLLKLESIEIPYKEGTKIKKIPAYLIKPSSIRGAVRRPITQILLDLGIEVCHTTDSLTDKEGNNLLVEGLHPLAWCDKKIRTSAINRLLEKKKKELGKTIKEASELEIKLNEHENKLNGFKNITEHCIIQRLFGSKHYKSKLSFYCKPICSIKGVAQKGQEILQEYAQFVHIATENRIVQTHDGKPVQDFAESYFSGWFEFEITVSQLAPYELGLLFNSLLQLKNLGRGFNQGYGHLKTENIRLIERKLEIVEDWTAQGVNVSYQPVELDKTGQLKTTNEEWKLFQEKYNQDK